MADRNLEDLTRAAKMKLQAQAKEKEEDKTTNENIYADMMNDEDEKTYPVIQPMPTDEPVPEFDENPIDENDFQIYDGGPYMSQVTIWKKQYGDTNVMHVKVVDKEFVFRTLNRFEYKQIIAMENVDALMREEIICTTCVLYPRNYNFKVMAKSEAGYPSTLSKIIMESSGFTSDYGIEIL